MSIQAKVKNVFNEIKANANNPLISHLFIGSKNVLNLKTVEFTEYFSTKYPDVKNTTVGVYLRTLKAQERKAKASKDDIYNIA
jgi:hypothetical protein